MDGLAERSLQELRHHAHLVVEIDDLGLEMAAAREGQQPPGEARARVGGLGGAANVIAGALVVDEGLEQLQISGDDGQKIVEVVGDAAGQLADGLEALRLQERLLAFHVFGQVAHEDDDAGAIAARTADDGAPRPRRECCGRRRSGAGPWQARSRARLPGRARRDLPACARSHPDHHR